MIAQPPSEPDKQPGGRLAGALRKSVAVAARWLSAAFIAPTDVVLSQHDVVQPDVLVVCDENWVYWVVESSGHWVCWGTWFE